MNTPEPVSTPAPPGAPASLSRYVLQSRLKVGGMAEIFLARTQGVGGFSTRVVIKRLLPHLAADPDFLRMFLAEARVLGSLRHPNLAQVFDLGQDGDSYFLVMEYVPGRDLGEILQAAARLGRPIALHEALAIGIGVCRGLHHAHTRCDDEGRPLRIVHRDVSPQNVMISQDGAVKLLDFGIARASLRTTLTQQGILRGKLPYMSPEQCTGSKLDHCSDVYAVGTLLYELTTGRLPFPVEDELELAHRIPEQDVPPPNTVRADYPPDLEAILLRALAREPKRRCPSALALQVDLERFAREQRLDVSDRALVALVETLFPQGPVPGVPVPPAVVGRDREARRARARDRLRARRWYRDPWALALACAAVGFGAACALAARHARALAEPVLLLGSYQEFDVVARAERAWLAFAAALGGLAVGALAGALARVVGLRRRVRGPGPRAQSASSAA